MLQLPVPQHLLERLCSAKGRVDQSDHMSTEMEVNTVCSHLLPSVVPLMAIRNQTYKNKHFNDVQSHGGTLLDAGNRLCAPTNLFSCSCRL